MSKTFSWVQPNYHIGSKKFNNYFLPYTVGILWSYVSQFSDITQRYKLGEILWKRDKIDIALSKIVHSDIVGFSTYIWNKNYNFELAKRLKKNNPNCFILFGGPEPPNNDMDIFTEHPYIDCIVKREGEVILKNVLMALGDRNEMIKVPGLLLNIDGKTVDTGNEERMNNLNDIPSPYLNGFFDKIISENPDCNWSAIHEPDRGCPYQCTFCDWGGYTYNKIKKFELQRLFDEIEWYGKNKIRMLMIANANFGIFPERDHLIADKIVEVKNKYGYPKSMYISWAKNQKKEVINIAGKLRDLTGLSVSIQTMTEQVLDVIKRSNLEINQIEETFKLCHMANIPVHSEMILGLPGETLDSWKDTLFRLFKAGNHTSISFFQAQILENTEMNYLQKKLYGIKSIPVMDFLSGSSIDEEIVEGVNTVIATKSMPMDDMVKALVFNAYVNTVHVNGMTTFISRFLYKKHKIEYKEFYEKLYEVLLSDMWFKNQLDEVESYYKNWLENGKIDHPFLEGNIEINGLNLYQRISINLYLNSKTIRPHLQKLIRGFVETCYGHFFSEDMLNELLKLQDLYFIDYDKVLEYPIIKKLKYDFVNYLIDDKPLDREVEYKFEFRGFGHVDTVHTFCEMLYYARRGQFSKARIVTLTEFGQEEVDYKSGNLYTL